MPDATSPDFRFFYITSRMYLGREGEVGRPVCMGSWLAAKTVTVTLQPTFTVEMPSSSDTTDTIAAFTLMPLAATYVGVSLRLLQCLPERLGAVAFCIRTSSVSLHGKIQSTDIQCALFLRFTWTRFQSQIASVALQGQQGDVDGPVDVAQASSLLLLAV